MYLTIRNEIVVKEFNATTSFYVFSKTALKKLFSNKSIHVKVAKVTLVTNQLLNFNP